MADLKTFHGPQGPVSLEVEGDGAGASGGGSLADLMSVVLDVASAALDQLNRIEEDKRPSEFEIRFGLKGLPDGGVAVTQTQENANFHVRMKWGGGGALSVPEP
jgi:hypothetical protein